MIVKCLLIAAGFFGGFAREDYTILSADVAPQVSFAIDESEIAIRAKSPYGKEARVTGCLAIARSKGMKYKIDKFPYKLKYSKSNLGKGDLRLALEVSWFNPKGELTDRRVYFSNPEEGSLPKDIRNMKVFDVKKHMQVVADRKRGIFIPVELEKSGVATVVIEDKNGKRIRNLMSAKKLKKGEHSIEWDGRDEFGRTVDPGEYFYRGITHDGITHEYLMQFYNGDEVASYYGSHERPNPVLQGLQWAPNHSEFTSITANSTNVFFGARVTEGCWNLVGLDKNGRTVKTFPQSHYRGCSYINIAVDDNYFYTIMQGHAFDGQPDVRERIGVVKYDLKTGNYVPKVGLRLGARVYVYESPDVDEKAQASMWDKRPVEEILVGSTIYNGELYVANSKEETLMVVNTETCLKDRDIKIAKPRSPIVVEGKLYVASGRDVVVYNEKENTFTKKFTVPFVIKSMSYHNGEFAMLGAEDSTIRIFSSNGKELATIGEPGGAYKGKWQPKRLVNPVAVQFAPDGTLWTTEKRTNPKRIVHWSRAGELIYEKYGSVGYGAPDLGFDPKDGSHIFANDMEWKIDYDKKTATPLAILTENSLFGNVLHSGGYYRQVAYYEGKEYIINVARTTKISERLKDGTLKAVACIGDASTINEEIRNFDYTDFEKFGKSEWNDEDRKETYYKKERWDRSNRGVFWLDRNGNGKMDYEEFEFMPRGHRYYGYFGLGTMGLEIIIPHKHGSDPERIVTLKPKGLLANGVLNYDLKEAFANSKEVEELPVGLNGFIGEEVYNDLRENIVVNSYPYMVSVSKDGKINWLYKNKYRGVHGSHSAPNYKRGQFVGTLMALGTAPMDKEGDVMTIISNTGLIYLMTTDGLYLDEVFHDGRVYSLMDIHNLGGEPFGGSFQYDATNKRYYFQGGHGSYRLYEFKGFDTVKRFKGKIKITKEQLEVAERRNPPEDDKVQKDVKTELTCVDGTAGFNKLQKLGKWSNLSLHNNFYAVYDKNQLVMRWEIHDPSPWKNNGKDWTLLFKTGDCVDFFFSKKQIDPKVKHPSPQDGDFRLLIAPFEGKEVGVLYRYKVDGDKSNLNPVTFSSPWRGYKVDDVKRIKLSHCEVRKDDRWYNIFVTVPLSELGLTFEDMKGAHRGDFGVIYGDSAGRVNTARVYWSDKETGLVNDIPGEMIPNMKNWGTIECGGVK